MILLEYLAGAVCTISAELLFIIPGIFQAVDLLMHAPNLRYTHVVITLLVTRELMKEICKRRERLLNNLKLLVSSFLTYIQSSRS